MISRDLRGRSIGLLAILTIAGFGLAGCDKVPLTAPSGSTITLFATSSVLPINGFTDIVATVTEAGGTPVHNGTLVTFTTTLGTLDPREARTHNGQVSTRLHVGNQSGTALVRAFSGSATTSADAQLEIRVGAAGAATIALSASQANLPFNGGTTTVIATVRDDSGNALPGAPVSFSSTAGTVSPTVAVTDQNGQATATVTTTRETTVTAAVAGQSSTITLTLDTRPGAVTVSITPPSTITEDLPANFTIAVNRDDTAPRVTNVRVDWGDGESTSLGAVSGSTTVQHRYRNDGTFTVTATAFDENGGTSTTSTQVFVADPAPLAVTVTANCSGSSCLEDQPITFTASGVANGATYRWAWGDGSTDTTTGASATHTYSSPGTYTVSVEVTNTDGQAGRGQTQVQVFGRTVSVSSTCPGTGGTCEAGESASFTATASGGQPVSYSWDFGDGGSAETSGNQATHAYAAAGTYQVRVTVRFSDGNQASGGTQVQVNP